MPVEPDLLLLFGIRIEMIKLLYKSFICLFLIFVVLFSVLIFNNTTSLKANIFFGWKGAQNFDKSGIKEIVEEKIFLKSKPNLLSASDGTYSDEIIIKWEKLNFADIYNVYRSLDPLNNYKKIGSLREL